MPAGVPPCIISPTRRTHAHPTTILDVSLRASTGLYGRMATIRPMRPTDLLRVSECNLDHLTETYNIGFYLEYLTKWPELCQIIEGMDGEIEGYSTTPETFSFHMSCLKMMEQH